MIPETSPPLPAVPEANWQPLPPRARTLFVATDALLLAIAAAVACTVLAAVCDVAPPVLAGAVGLLTGAAAGATIGTRRHRRTQWLLDGDGLAVARGHWWRRETRVPASRVQHIDLKHGPLERRWRLATVVVHTAGSKLGAVTLSGLDAADAEALRDRLARNADNDDDAL